MFQIYNNIKQILLYQFCHIPLQNVIYCFIRKPTGFIADTIVIVCEVETKILKTKRRLKIHIYFVQSYLGGVSFCSWRRIILQCCKSTANMARSCDSKPTKICQGCCGTLDHILLRFLTDLVVWAEKKKAYWRNTAAVSSSFAYFLSVETELSSGWKQKHPNPSIVKGWGQIFDKYQIDWHPLEMPMSLLFSQFWWHSSLFVHSSWKISQQCQLWKRSLEDD